MRKLKYVKLFENFGVKSGYYISDLVDEVKDLPETMIRNGQALETLMSLLPKLSKTDAQKFIKSHLFDSGTEILFRISRPMGKDVDVPISEEIYSNLKRDYFDGHEIVA